MDGTQMLFFLNLKSLYWHYKQISKTQSLHQVQVRDRIKLKVIEKHGYIPYIIKDTGKYNISFVKQEFELFCLMKMDY